MYLRECECECASASESERDDLDYPMKQELTQNSSTILDQNPIIKSNQLKLPSITTEENKNKNLARSPF